MTERIHYSDAIVTTPLALNPVQLANTLSNRKTVTLGRFKTNLLIRYLPNVSTETTGSVAFAVSQTPHTTLASIAAVQPSYVGPVWRPAILNIPKSLLNLQSWLAADSRSLYLVAANAQGSFSITTTLALATSTNKPEAPIPDPMLELGTLSTVAYVGPRLEGFSLVCCAPNNVGAWTGDGLAMNIDLTRATGKSTLASYGLRTPDNKPYVAVRFGMSSSYKWNYTTNNKSYSWKANTQLYSYSNRDPPTSALAASYHGSWRTINGSTSWWCDVRPTSSTGVVNGGSFTWYVPMCLLVLYYHFPNTDIFDPLFDPELFAHPGLRLPDPSGDAVVAAQQRVPMLMGILQQLWSPWWNPVNDPFQVNQLQHAKTALLSWPTTQP